MIDASAETRSLVVVRELAHPPEKVWRALTLPHLIEEWLMKNDFAPIVGRCFDLRADWGSVACEVITIEPPRVLAYSWCANGLDSVVTWTLVRTATGTSLRMEQTGFLPGQRQAYLGAKAGWPRFLASLEQVVARAI